MDSDSREASGSVLGAGEGTFTREVSLPLQKEPDAQTASCRGPKERVDISAMCS